MTIRRLLSLLILLALMRDEGTELVKLDLDHEIAPEDDTWVIDLDGDGDLDVVDQRTPNETFVYLNPGPEAGALKAEWEWSPVTSVGWVDLNGDGVADPVTTERHVPDLVRP